MGHTASGYGSVGLVGAKGVRVQVFKAVGDGLRR